MSDIRSVPVLANKSLLAMKTAVSSAVIIVSAFLTASLISCREKPMAPVVTTSDALGITRNSATAGGNVTDEGGEEVTVRGVCWHTAENPTTSGNKSSDGSGPGSYTSDMNGLTPGTRYYVRAYAVNNSGTGYGKNVSFVTEEVGMATVTTDKPSSVTSSTAVSGGTITDDGGGNITARGVCWAKKSSGMPTVSNFKTNDGSGAEPYISTISGLEPGSDYYVRAYATNISGTAYGASEEFRTSASLPKLTTDTVISVTASSARSGGEVVLDGGSQVTVRGICWDTSPNPTTDKNKTINGSGTGQFVSDLIGLNANTNYYVRAYAVNSLGTNYGNQRQFTTRSGIVGIITRAVSDITAFTAKCGGDVTDDGGSPITVRGVCWNTAGNPTTASSKTSDGGGTGSFTSNLTNLQPGTRYYVRAYVTNAVGTTYGNQQEFPARDGIVSLTVNAPLSVTAASASCGGSIGDDGGSPVTARGICWSTSQNPTTAGSRTTDGSGTGSFASSLTGLVPNTTYYIRAYATNAVATSYSSNQESIRTKDGTAILTTNTVSSIMAASAGCGGSITDDGGSAVTERGICWGTGPGPSVAGSHAASGSGTGSFPATLTGLLPNTTYYVRAYAINSIRTTYGNERSFSTRNGIPSISTADVTNVKAATVSAGGNITDDGGSSITARGVCWSTNPNPTTANSKTTDGMGAGIFTSTPFNLQHYTKFYLRAYATSVYATSYGDQKEFTTLVGDADGNSYHPVVIGSQTWLKENLRTTKYNDGTGIPSVTANADWANLTSPAYCWYDNDQGYKPDYGALYTWYTVKTGKLCPAGWHVPTDAEWTILENTVGGLAVAGGKLKETGLLHWADPNAGATDQYGFTALPGGWREGNGGGSVNLKYVGNWWTSSEYSPDAPYWRYIDWDKLGVARQYGGDPSFGLSVRCIKDYVPKK